MMHALETTVPASPIRRRGRRASRPLVIGAVASALVLSGCSGATADSADADTVTLVVHDSFPNDEFASAASEATGYDVEVVSAGDGGELTNKLVLTKGAPIADAFFGVDTMFVSRLVENDVVEAYTPKDLPAGAADFMIDADADAENDALAASVIPVDFGATCVNIDPAWFEEHGIDEPETYEDLASAALAEQTVLLDPTASSTGASFLVGTIAEFGEEGFVDYWGRLVDRGARIEQGWSDAYYGQFTQGGEDGTKPIVVSYASSPAFTMNEAGDASTTKALLDTCTRQVEYAGVLAGTENPEGAEAVIDYLVSNDFQQTIPEAMYMNPVDETVELPEEWARFAPEPSAEQARDLTPSLIEQNRERWLKELSERIGL